MVRAVTLVCISGTYIYIGMYIDFHHEERRSQRSSFWNLDFTILCEKKGFVASS